MKHPNPSHWRGLEEWEDPTSVREQAETEFIDTPLRIGADPGRRDFLKATGFLVAATSFTACTRPPEEKALPPVVQLEGDVPGKSYRYATVCGACPSACGIVAKVRDGRPIKLEGNPAHPLTHGGLCATGQASILSLYDSHRVQSPRAAGKEISWEDADRQIAAALSGASQGTGAVRVLSPTITSPTLLRQVASFLGGFKDGKHIVADPASASAILDAHERTHGARRLPHYQFAKAEVIASFDADFLGSWLSAPEFTRGYTESRLAELAPRKAAWHTQVEARYTMSGGKADERVKVAPWEVAAALEHLVAKLGALAGKPFAPGSNAPSAEVTAVIGQLAQRLWNARGKSLVLYGPNEVAGQQLANLANELLGNYGNTLDLSLPSLQRQGNDRDLAQLLTEITEGKVTALFVLGMNPAADLPLSEDTRRALGQIPLLVSLAPREDETVAIAKLHCPDSDPFESWGDAEPVAGLVSVQQPLIQQIGKARSAIESFAAWAGKPGSAYDLVQAHWREAIHPRATTADSFEIFWRKTLHDGFANVRPTQPAATTFTAISVAPLSKQEAATAMLQLYMKPGMLDGSLAYNPWLQELPDPVTKATWDNYASISPAKAKELGVKNGDVVRVAVGDISLELPALVQAGQHDALVAVALGYGRKLSARFQDYGPKWIDHRASTGANGLVGINASPLLAFEAGMLAYLRPGVTLATTGKRQALAVTQSHHTLSVPENLDPGGPPRPIVQEVYLSEPETYATADKEEAPELWPPDHPYPGHRWGMAIDLDACTGCAACVVACQIENNVPVVGKDEVMRKREMHWIRIDRYYSGDVENPSSAHQPMLCQHCENAPCETVCPVLATVHSSEGLSQQVYNRCIGTRYCANNCPYKVRRFNWFNYPREDKLANLLLNPDVTVRSRGVMEKCSFCIQRIQEAKIEAKREGRELKDGDVVTACQQSCPADAIIFGDMNNPESKVAKWIKNPRRYRVLEEINVRPSVHYLKIVKRSGHKPGEEHHG